MSRRPKHMTRPVTVDVRFVGDGRVVETPRGGLFGGVADPDLGPGFAFNVRRAVLDETGVANPVAGEGTYAGALQINVIGSGDDYAELGRFFLGLAALDTNLDPEFHHHFENIVSVDDRTKLHIIVRRVQGGPSHVVV